MNTLLNYLKSPNNKGVIWWVRFYYKNLLSNIYAQKVKQNNKDYVGIKLQSSVIPEGWSRDNAFKYLEKEWRKDEDFKVFKRFKD